MEKGPVEQRRALEARVHETIRELQLAAHDGEWQRVSQEGGVLQEIVGEMEALENA